MRQRDFFAFCTALKPIELKAIGELSWVRHLAEGDVLYSPGEPGNALYIVNRGVLEISQKGRQGNKVVLLGRGDLVGDVEVFADMRRTQMVRAKEAASLQCFPRANFPELLRLVPDFYRYLCEQMAARLLKERDLADDLENSLELSGRISNFDLTTIHQTIMSSGQTGELSIQDETGHTVGAFYFETGRPRAARFQHLTGEDAFWQLFLSDQLSGTFSFSVGEHPLTDANESAPIAPRNDLLITALQYRDELDALKKGMKNHSEKLRARATDLKWNGAAPEPLRPLAEQVWNLLGRGPKTIAELYRECGVCELKIFQVVSELLYSDQASFTGDIAQSPPPTPAATMPEVAERPTELAQF
jgi:CRP-like cAMP-binding protein